MAKGKTPEEMIPGIGKPKPVGLFAWLRGRFFAGMVIAAPLAATFLILQFLITFIDNRVKPLLPPLLKPETYMNISGKAVQALMRFYKIRPEDILVVFDDLDTMFGNVKFKAKGSSGGHNGIKSLIASIGSNVFACLAFNCSAFNLLISFS